jgi:hypothetical protein
MAPAHNSRTLEDVRRDLEVEREQLASAAQSLSERVGKLRAKLPFVAAGALGLGAATGLLSRRGRKERTKAKRGRCRLVDDD